MKVLRLDFNNSFGMLKNVDKLKEKIEALVSKYNISYSEFFEMISSCRRWAVSTPNFDREITGQDRGLGRLRNYFFRSMVNLHEASKLGGNTIAIKGNIVVKKDRYDIERSFIEVVDVYLTSNSDCKKYEHAMTVSIDCKTRDKDFSSREANAIDINEFLAVPKLCSTEKLGEFVGKWSAFVEFQRAITMSSIDYKRIENLVFHETVEVKNKEQNRAEYDGYIVARTSSQLYIRSDCPTLDGGSKYVIMGVNIRARQFVDSARYNRGRVAERFFRKDASIMDKFDVELLKDLKSDPSIDKEPAAIILGDYIGFECSRTSATRVVSSSFSKSEKSTDGVSGTKDVVENIKDTEMYTAYYFIPEAMSGDKYDVGGYINSKKKLSKAPLYLGNAVTGEVALCKRAEKAIRDLYDGNVKSPFVAGLIVEPEKFESSIKCITESDIEYQQSNLNDSQKQAVLKCLNSDSIFLIQGPPGTGKTQTITELVYQYNKMGKKVAVSSQTHIAIDNVIERLPKEPNILPIRMVSDKRRGSSNYLPDQLLENFYLNTLEVFNAKIKKVEKFGLNIAEKENDLISNREIALSIKSKREDVLMKSKLVSRLSRSVTKYHDKVFQVNSDMLQNERAQEMVDDYIACDFNPSIIKCNYDHRELAQSLMTGSVGKFDTSQELNIEAELSEINYFIDKHCGDYKISKLECTLEKLRQENLLKIGKNSLTELQENAKDIEDIVELEKSLSIILKLREKYSKTCAKYITDSYVSGLHTEKKVLINKQCKLAKKVIIAETSLERATEERDEIYLDIKTESDGIEEYFVTFFSDELHDSNLPKTDEEKFDKISDFIVREKIEFAEQEEEFKRGESVYTSVRTLIEGMKDEKTGVLNISDWQKEQFTRPLFVSSANVYGFTCTASPSYREEQNSYLRELGLGSMYLGEQDFDVVIIDEVSKATPMEIIIPMLYGKSVVLVGDQRQLPPVFKYRDNIFDEMSVADKKSIMKDKTLSDFKEMVESSLFEEIFNKLKNNKAMLYEQYRFNSQIMECVNVFYNEPLKNGGGESQNNKKQHYLDIKADGGKYNIINRQDMTYWLSSKAYKDGTPAYEEQGSIKETSKVNKLEAKMTVELIKKIDAQYGELYRNNRADYDKASGDGAGHKPSLAVITMYGEQIRTIQNALRAEKFKAMYVNFNIRGDIATVDNFQGKEKDIVIVNLVRSFNKDFKSSGYGEFITKFNRINVAISRARNMLIMIGNPDFYKDISINVPDIGSEKKKMKFAYKEIYDKCTAKYISASKMLGIGKE